VKLKTFLPVHDPNDGLHKDLFLLHEYLDIDFGMLGGHRAEIEIVALSRGLKFFEAALANDKIAKARRMPAGTRFVADPSKAYLLQAARPSRTQSDFKFHLRIGGRDLLAALTVIELSLDADVNRDGEIEYRDERRHRWDWGPNGSGAVVLVNNDRDIASNRFGFRDRRDRRRGGPLDMEDMALIDLTMGGPRALPPGYELRLKASEAAAAKVRVFNRPPGTRRQLIGPDEPVKHLSWRPEVMPLAVEALQYPDYGYSGLLTLSVIVTFDGDPVTGDTLVMRVAPWLALPCTQPARVVYVSRLDNGQNRQFIDDMHAIAAAAGAQLVEVESQYHRGDRWMQDEIEVGYSQSPTKILPVVLDSPRDRGLDDFPERLLLGSDFGYVSRTDAGTQVNSLDSFGNLECTPPLPKYPLGRILFGGAKPDAHGGYRMMKVVSDFMYAQSVQEPIELYSDWLSVGHVDEFVTFVPSPAEPGYRVLLASPRLAYRILDDLVERGHGSNRCLVDRYNSQNTLVEKSVADLAQEKSLRETNERFQLCIDWNRSVLKAELGVTSDDFIELPVLFEDDGNGRADALTADVINLVVLNGHVAIPKPFGPLVDGVCQFEAHTRGALEPLGLTVHFVDTWYSYHVQSGGAHCGTNVLRAPFQALWWNHQP